MKVLLTGGGTGGHIYPALAVARRLEEMESDLELLYVGTSRGLESNIIPKAGIAFKSIEIEGFKRQLNFEGIKYNLKSLVLFIKSIFKAKEIIRDFKPDIVLGTGGYVSAPICYAASREGVASIAHEQNSYLGLTNKFLLPFIDKLAISFDDIYEQTNKYQEKVVFTGNPRSQELSLAEESKDSNLYGLDPKKKIVAVLGGSRGAEKINQTIIQAYPELIKKEYQLIFATGEVHYENIVEELNALSPLENHSNIVVKGYIDNMVELLQNTSVLITRSGATTIAEITALGIPSILIPSPYVTADHQTKNAMSLVNNDAAIILEEKELTGSLLIDKLDALLLNTEKLNKMATASKKMAEPTATDQLIQLMLDELKKRN